MATETATMQGVQQQFEQAGFAVNAPRPGQVAVKKSGCVAYLESRGGSWIHSGPPYFIIRGIPCELEDHGYQKFWLSKSEARRFPIRKVDLEVLHRFDEEVRYILGLKNLYNESLGTTNARTVYDRLTGRPDR
jgi:hypothetical protein